MQNSSNRPYFTPQTNKQGISPVSAKQQYLNYGAMTERLMTPPQTEIKISKTIYKNGNPTPPNTRHFRSESSHTFVIEKSDSVSLRLQNLNQTKVQLYNDLNQMNNENKALNGKLQNLQNQYQSHNQTTYSKDNLIQELMKIKEILDKCDFRNDQVSLQYSELQTIQSIIYNITNNLKLFEEKLSLLWNETERLGREVIDWQNTCTHQDAVYQIRINDLTQQFSQKTFQSNITINDAEYTNRIKGLEKRVNELEVVILKINNEKESILKEMKGGSSDLYGKIKGSQKEYDEKILVLTSQIEKLLKIVEEKNQLIDSLRMNFNKNSGGNYNKSSKNSFDNYNNNSIDNSFDNFNKPFETSNKNTPNKNSYNNNKNYNENSYQISSENHPESFTKPYPNEKTKAAGQISSENTPNFIHLQQVNKELMQSIQTKVHECNETKLLCGELKKEKMNFLEKIKYLETQIALFKEDVSKSQDKKASYDKDLNKLLEKAQMQIEELYRKNQDLEALVENLRKNERNYQVSLENMKGDLGLSNEKHEKIKREFTNERIAKNNSNENELRQAQDQVFELNRRNKSFEEMIVRLQNEDKVNKNFILEIDNQLKGWRDKYNENEKKFVEKIEAVQKNCNDEKYNEMVIFLKKIALMKKS